MDFNNIYSKTHQFLKDLVEIKSKDLYSFNYKCII